jgi:hypothetical protein
MDFRYLWGNIMMVDVLRDPMRFRVRLHGTEMASRAGYDMTGKTLDALPDSEYRTYVISRCEALVDSVAPDVVHHDRILDGRVWRYEALWLPFSDDGRTVSTLLCALIYQDRERYEAHRIARDVTD